MSRRKRTGQTLDMDMTPLIDVTFQLIAFFMFTINFNQEALQQEVKLPTSATAQAVSDVRTNRIFINVVGGGRILVPGDPIHLETASGRTRFAIYMQTEQKSIRRKMEIEGKDPSGVLDAMVIVRADAGVEAGVIQDLLKIARESGFSRFSLRVRNEN